MSKVTSAVNKKVKTEFKKVIWTSFKFEDDGVISEIHSHFEISLLNKRGVKNQTYNSEPDSLSETSQQAAR